jgi:hypothetical protein
MVARRAVFRYERYWCGLWREGRLESSISLQRSDKVSLNERYAAPLRGWAEGWRLPPTYVACDHQTLFHFIPIPTTSQFPVDRRLKKTSLAQIATE